MIQAPMSEMEERFKIVPNIIDESSLAYVCTHAPTHEQTGIQNAYLTHKQKY